MLREHACEDCGKAYFAKIDLKLFYITRKFDKHTLDNLKNFKKKD